MPPTGNCSSARAAHLRRLPTVTTLYGICRRNCVESRTTPYHRPSSGKNMHRNAGFLLTIAAALSSPWSSVRLTFTPADARARPPWRTQAAAIRPPLALSKTPIARLFELPAAHPQFIPMRTRIGHRAKARAGQRIGFDVRPNRGVRLVHILRLGRHVDNRKRPRSRSVHG
jgi:hypothetical protein